MQSEILFLHKEHIMIKIKPLFMYSEKGEKIGVVLKLRDFEKLIDVLEDFCDYKYIKKYAAKTTKVVPLEQVMAEIMRK